MDPSTQVVEDVQNQTLASQPTTAKASDQSGQSQVTSAQSPSVPTPSKTQISVSGGGLEAGSAIIQEDPDADDDEEELKVAPQETKNRTSMGQGNEEEENNEQQVVSGQPSVVDVSEQVEIQPAIPEVAISSPEVEKIVEVTPPEAPKITEELKDIGLTHSGPGIIDASQANITPKAPPVTYEQVLLEEEKIKNNRLHNSKFWLLEKIKYLWRKINPDIAMTVKKPTTQQTVPVKPKTVITNQVSATENTDQK